MEKKTVHFSVKELQQLVQDPFAQVTLRRRTRQMALHPAQLHDVKGSIKHTLNSSVCKFDSKLKGIPLSFKNVLMSSNQGMSDGDRPRVYFKVEADVYIFTPSIGCTLKGIVTKKSLNHIGCLVHKTFNVSIPCPAGVENGEWPEVKVELGSLVTFEVVVLDMSGELPYIKGKLLPSSAESSIKQASDAETESAADVHEIKKKKKKKHKKENLQEILDETHVKTETYEEETTGDFTADESKKKKKKKKEKRSPKIETEIVEEEESFDIDAILNSYRPEDKKAKKKQKQDRIDNEDVVANKKPRLTTEAESEYREDDVSSFRSNLPEHHHNEQPHTPTLPLTHSSLETAYKKIKTISPQKSKIQESENIEAEGDHASESLDQSIDTIRTGGNTTSEEYFPKKEKKKHKKKKKTALESTESEAKQISVISENVITERQLAQEGPGKESVSKKLPDLPSVVDRLHQATQLLNELLDIEDQRGQHKIQENAARNVPMKQNVAEGDSLQSPRRAHLTDVTRENDSCPQLQSPTKKEKKKKQEKISNMLEESITVSSDLGFLNTSCENSEAKKKKSRKDKTVPITYDLSLDKNLNMAVSSVELDEPTSQDIVSSVGKDSVKKGHKKHKKDKLKKGDHLSIPDNESVSLAIETVSCVSETSVQLVAKVSHKKEKRKNTKKNVSFLDSSVHDSGINVLELDSVKGFSPSKNTTESKEARLIKSPQLTVSKELSNDNVITSSLSAVVPSQYSMEVKQKPSLLDKQGAHSSTIKSRNRKSVSSSYGDSDSTSSVGQKRKVESKTGKLPKASKAVGNMTTLQEMLLKEVAHSLNITGVEEKKRKKKHVSSTPESNQKSVQLNASTVEDDPTDIITANAGSPVKHLTKSQLASKHLSLQLGSPAGDSKTSSGKERKPASRKRKQDTQPSNLIEKAVTPPRKRTKLSTPKVSPRKTAITDKVALTFDSDDGLQPPLLGHSQVAPELLAAVTPIPLKKLPNIVTSTPLSPKKSTSVRNKLVTRILSPTSNIKSLDTSRNSTIKSEGHHTKSSDSKKSKETKPKKDKKVDKAKDKEMNDKQKKKSKEEKKKNKTTGKKLKQPSIEEKSVRDITSELLSAALGQINQTDP